MYLFKNPNNKRGNAALKALMGVGVALAVVVIAVVMMFMVAVEGKNQIITTENVNVSDASTYTTAYNSTVDTITAVGTLPDWMPIIVLVLVGVVLLLLIKVIKN